MQRFDWKVGQKIPLQSTIFPNSDGSKNWAFDIVGVLRNAEGEENSWYNQMLLLHYKYFEESTPYVDGDVGWYVSQVADVNQADRIVKAIDAPSANSDHKTKLMQSEHRHAGSEVDSTFSLTRARSPFKNKKN